MGRGLPPARVRARETPSHYRALQAQLDAISAELRKRVGDVYDLDRLAAEYRQADAWAHRLFADLPPEARWSPGLTIATDAAFHLFARRAQDYAP
ncbi:MAG TPA: hypothetical protein VH760_07625 [Gaiellaceae bacterium]